MAALRLVHEQIYAAEKFDHVELVSYLRELAGAVLRSRQPEGGTIELVWDVKPLSVSPDIAIPLGLITTEFITNSAKYAFDRDGTIWVHLDQPAVNKARLVLSDNGRGIGKRSASGTGMRLIDGLATQLKAEPRWESDAGTRLSLVFPIGDVDVKQNALSRTG